MSPIIQCSFTSNTAPLLKLVSICRKQFFIDKTHFVFTNYIFITKCSSSQVYKKIKEFESRLTEGLGVCLTTTGTTARQGSSNSSQQSDRLRYHPPHHHSHLTPNGLRSQASTKLKARHHQPQTQHSNHSSGK